MGEPARKDRGNHDPRKITEVKKMTDNMPNAVAIVAEHRKTGEYRKINEFFLSQKTKAEKTRDNVDVILGKHDLNIDVRLEYGFMCVACGRYGETLELDSDGFCKRCILHKED